MVRATASSSAGRSSRARKRRVTSTRPRSGEMVGRLTCRSLEASAPSDNVMSRLGRMQTRTGDLNARRADDPCRPPSGVQLLAVVATRATPATAATPTAAVTAGPILLRRPRRRILRPLDQLLRLDESAVL